MHLSLPPARPAQPSIYSLGLAGAAIGAGLLIGRLTPAASLGLLAGIAALGVAFWEPALGIGLAIALGPARAFVTVAWPQLPGADPGQVFFILAAAGWLARGALRRDLRVPQQHLLIPLAAFILAGALSLLAAISLEEGLKELLKWLEVALALVILESEFRRGRAAGSRVAARAENPENRGSGPGFARPTTPVFGSFLLRGRAGGMIGIILAAGAAQALAGLWQYEFQDPDRGPAHFRILGDHFRAYGSFEQPNPYGGYLGLIWPLAAGLALAQAQTVITEKWGARANSPPARPIFRNILRGFLWAGLAGLCLTGLYLSFSRGAWLGAAAAALVLVVWLPRRPALGLALAAGGLALGWAVLQAGLLPAGVASRLADIGDFARVGDVRGENINDLNFAILERLAHWQAAESMARASPWLGVGIGNYAAAYPEHRLLNWPNALGHAHMIYLNVLAEMGVVGLMTYVMLWAWVIGHTIRVVGRVGGPARGLALGLLGAWTHLSVHQVVDNLYVNNIHFLLAALLALLAWLSRSSGSGETEIP